MITTYYEISYFGFNFDRKSIKFFDVTKDKDFQNGDCNKSWSLSECSNCFYFCHQPYRKREVKPKKMKGPNIVIAVKGS